MLHWFAAAPALIAAPLPAQQNAATPTCNIGPVAVSFMLEPGVPVVPSFGWSPAAIDQVIAIGGAVTEPREKPIQPDAQLPSSKPENREPAQAMPECREQPPKRRKRKSDYPMV